LTLKTVPRPEVRRPNDVLIEVEACGICGSDVGILAVPPGHPANVDTILGHEFFGHVVEIGAEVNHVKPGDRVAIAPVLSCGVCPCCRLGMSNHCPNWSCLGIFIDGAFAKYTIAPASAVLPLDPKLPAEEAVFIEPLSCVYAATSKLAIQPGEVAVVLGAGPIGLIFTKVLKASGAGKIIATDVAAFRREWATRAGADIVVDPREQDLEAVIQAETEIGAQVVVDAVGSLANPAVHVAARGGRVCLFGVNSNARPEIDQALVTLNELNVFGTHVGVNMFPHAIRILESGVVSLAELISHRLPLSEIHDAFAAIQGGQSTKIMIVP